MTTEKSYSEILEKQFGRLTFAKILRSWRLCDEMTQTAFAKKLGLSVQNLNDLEKGRRIPSPKRAARIAKKLGLIESVLIQIALRDALFKEGFKYEVTLKKSA